MTRYVAFLRGVNVGGHTMVKTADICRELASRGYSHVKGYRQSGNIIFDAVEQDPGRIISDVQEVIFGLIGKRVEVFLRTTDYIRAVVNADPFKDVAGDVKRYVTFFHREPAHAPVLPHKSPEGDAEIVLVRGREAYAVAYPKDGRYGASYGKMVEKLGTPNSSRDWNTIKGIAALPDR